MTTQHPQVFSFGACFTSIACGIGFGLGALDICGVPCIRGMVLYPAFGLRLALAGLPLLLAGFDITCNGHPGSFSLPFSPSSWRLLAGEGGCSPRCVCTAKGVNPLRASDSDLHSFSRFCCSSWSFLACVGNSCCSGGKRGSGLNIVASHGGSPSGRLMAVAGLGSSPERDFGRCPEVIRGFDGDRGFCASTMLPCEFDVLREPDDKPALLTTRGLVGDVETLLGLPEYVAAGVGLLCKQSPSSNRTRLPTL